MAEVTFQAPCVCSLSDSCELEASFVSRSVAKVRSTSSSSAACTATSTECASIGGAKQIALAWALDMRRSMVKVAGAEAGS